MNNYVVDASILAQHVVLDTYTSNVDALLTESAASIQLHIPEFCLLECANVIWKQVNINNLSAAHAESLIVNLTAFPLVIHPASVLLKHSLSIAAAHNLAVYDSIYIALAEHLQFALITADGKQEKAARALGITIKPVTDFQS